MTKYVLGFLFDASGQKVALIQKAKPDWQKGKWNGIGGKIEEGESAFDAMLREFDEETGVDTPLVWNQFLLMRNAVVGSDFRVYCFRAFDNVVEQVRTTTIEPVSTFSVTELPPNTLPNVRWLVPLAHDRQVFMTEACY